MQPHFESFGEGYPLIILHGLFGSLENWQTVSRTLARCYRVFALDQRNHGNSPHSDEFNYAAMANDVREFMDAQQLSSAYLLGHSMGGKTNTTTGVRPSRFFHANYSHAGGIPQTNSDVAKSRLFERRRLAFNFCPVELLSPAREWR